MRRYASPVRRPRREIVRRRLLDAALTVFAERGFASANLDQVAAAAGLTKGAIYSNFANKDELFFAMMADQVLRRVETIEAAMAQQDARTRTASTSRYRTPSYRGVYGTQREWQLVFVDFWRRAVR